jgi:hypothetical protein
MQENEFAKNTALFMRELRTTSHLPEPVDTLKNIKDTIKEYREYTHPFSQSWNQYIHEVFHILGFNTVTENKRLITLTEMGGVRARRAIVVLIGE